MRAIYTFLFYLALPFILLRLLWRSRHTRAYRQRWGERFGFCPVQLEKSIWIHAVSVGETVAALPLIKQLKIHYPDFSIVVTNTTITGAERTKALLGDAVIQLYLPYDLPRAIQRFVKRIQPEICIIVETELWPNLCHVCKVSNIPVVVANARLSAKSAAGYRRFSRVTQEMLATIRMMLVQTQTEAIRFSELGLPSDACVVTGNIKFDIELSETIVDQSAQLRESLGNDRLIWIAASTHAGEEEIILAVHQEMIKRIPHALLILVPRHPERFDGVHALVKKMGFRVARRSQEGECGLDTAVYLGDTMGELCMMYAAADVAFVGGSLVAVGGHNVLEPAALSKPILIGPHYFNFAEITNSLISAQGLIKVDDEEQLTLQLYQLFQNANKRFMMGMAASAFVVANRGALAQQVNAINEILSAKKT